MVFQLSLVIIATHYNNKVSVSSSVNYCYASNTIGHIFFFLFIVIAIITVNRLS